MSNLNLYFSLGINFAKKYAVDYIKALLLPVAVGLFGGLFVFLTLQNPNFAFAALFISIPCICFSFWRGYVATFALNFAAFNFYKKGEDKPFEVFINLVNKKELASYLGFYAIITILFFSPALFFLLKTVSLTTLFTNPLSVLSNPFTLIPAIVSFFIITILLLPFTNFLNQAFFLKKKNEGFINLLANCYRLQDGDGIILSIIFPIISGVINSLHPIIILIGSLALNLLSFSINTFWYYDRLKEDEMYNAR